MNDDLKEALDILDELGGTMAAENCPLSHVLLEQGHVVEGALDKFGRKTISRPKKNENADKGFLSDIIKKLEKATEPSFFKADTTHKESGGVIARVGFDMETCSLPEAEEQEKFAKWEVSKEEVDNSRTLRIKFLKDRKDWEPRHDIGRYFINIDYAQLEMRVLEQERRDREARAEGRCCSWDTDNDGECPRHPGPGRPDATFRTETGRTSFFDFKNRPWRQPWTERRIVGFTQLDEKFKDVVIKKPEPDPHAEAAREVFDLAWEDYAGRYKDLFEAWSAEVEAEQDYWKNYWRRQAKSISFAGLDWSPRANTHLKWQEFVDRVMEDMPQGGKIHFTCKRADKFYDRLQLKEEITWIVETLDAAIVIEETLGDYADGPSREISITQGNMDPDLPREAHLVVELNQEMTELTIIKNRDGHLGDTIDLPPRY